MSAARRAGSPCRSPRRIRAAAARRAASSGASSRYPMAAASWPGRPGGTSRPVSPGITRSGTALTAADALGQLAAADPHADDLRAPQSRHGGEEILGRLLVGEPADRADHGGVGRQAESEAGALTRVR